MGGIRSFVPRKPSGEWGGNESFVRRQRSGGWEEAGRMYDAVRENSIDFPRTPYRLFPDTSVRTLEQHWSNDPFVWKHSSVSSVEKSANVRGNRGRAARGQKGFLGGMEG